MVSILIYVVHKYIFFMICSNYFKMLIISTATNTIHGNGHSNGFSQIQMQFPQQIQSLLSGIITTLARSWRGWKEQKAVLGQPANATGSCTIWQTPCTLLMYLPLCHAQCPGLTRVGSIPGQLPHTSATGPITSWISLEKLVRLNIVISKRVVLDACCG